MRLICELRLDIPECNQRFAVDFRHHFSAELETLRAMANDGLVRLEESTVSVTERGRPFLRNICMVFDAYLDTATQSSPINFSATL